MSKLKEENLQTKSDVKNMWANVLEKVTEVETPVQKRNTDGRISPIETPNPLKKPISEKKAVVSKKGEETYFNVAIQTKLLKKLKIKAVNDGVSIKDLINSALHNSYGE
jgi:predicted DNA binding CopG/RHH family protein